MFPTSNSRARRKFFDMMCSIAAMCIRYLDTIRCFWGWVSSLDMQLPPEVNGDLGIFWVVPPPRMPVANESLQGSPTKNVIILVVTATGRGDNPW